MKVGGEKPDNQGKRGWLCFLDDVQLFKAKWSWEVYIRVVVSMTSFFFLKKFIWLCQVLAVACEVSFLDQVLNWLPASGAWSLSHCTTREVPSLALFTEPCFPGGSDSKEST